ncbi:phosphotransferase family protein, partial [Lineolata rhizophorae]
MEVRVAEAQYLLAVRKTLGDKVPVPEVYGLRVDGRIVFIYMQLIRGATLKERWGTLNDSDKAVICDQLRQMVNEWRQLAQDPLDQFIGSIGRQPLLDVVFKGLPPTGPFLTIQAFHDWLSWLPGHLVGLKEKINDPYRQYLPDTGPITFTHADLHRGNIIVSETSPPRIIAIVDWALAGWYPDYWEYCKANYTARFHEDWRDKWIPYVLRPREFEFRVFAEYMNFIGAV